MPNLSKIRTTTIIATALVVLVLAWLAWPNPVPVDLAAVPRAAMEVTVDEEARTRIQHVYTVSAPLTGTVLRPDREVGDAVVANETIVAVMKPSAPSFHDPRLHQELQSTLAAANAATVLAEAEIRRIQAALNFSRSELRRMQSLAGQGAIARSTLDRTVADVQTHEAALASARAELEVRRNERDGAAARVQNPTGTTATSDDPDCCVRIRTPVSGQILRLIEESEAVVQAGAPLIEIGDPQDLEILAELLSTDAVAVRVGQAVHIDGWGGASVRGRVKRIEPVGFMKVSALGIEEQRVRVLIEFTDPPSQWSNLGPGYRVIVHVVTWQGSNVLTVPVGALFRANEKWAVFRNEGGRARSVEVVIGHRNSRVAEVVSGISNGDQIVLHASDRVSDGSRIANRE
jgi:HlyD family secretion protein